MDKTHKSLQISRPAKEKGPGGFLAPCGIDSTVPWYAALALLVGLGTVATFLGPINHDVGIGLSEANRVVDGAKLYVDLVDNNPPLWVWLSVPPVILSRMTGGSDIVFVQLCQVLLAVLSAWLSSRVLVSAAIFSSVLVRRLLILGLLVFLLAVPGPDLGQRDWIMIALFMPYVLLSAGRAVNKGVSPPLAVLVGVLAAVGVALKPFFLLPWLGIEIYLTFFRRVGWPWRRIESVCFAAGHAFYVVMILLLTPQFIESLRLTARVYSAWNCTNQQLVLAFFKEAPLVVVAITLFLLVRPTADDVHLRRVLLIATVGLLGTAVVQHKGFSYHFLPCAIAGGMLLLVILASLCRDTAANNAIFRPRAPAMALLILAAMAAQSGANLYTAEGLHRAWTSDPEGPWDLVSFLKENAHGRPVAILSTLVSPIFPALNYAHLSCGTRYACLWMLPNFYQDAQSRADGTVYRTRAEMDEVERFAFDAVIEDLLKSKPGVVVVDICPQKWAFGTAKFDYVEYYSRDIRFAAFWKDYRMLDEFGGQALFVRNPPGIRAESGYPRN